jgi:hypothetical protein
MEVPVCANTGVAISDRKSTAGRILSNLYTVEFS